MTKSISHQPSVELADEQLVSGISFSDPAVIVPQHLRPEILRPSLSTSLPFFILRKLNKFVKYYYIFVTCASTIASLI